jgi:alpha-L-arabinofuranosidase
MVNVVSADVLTGPHEGACNTYEQPSTITSQPFRAMQIQNGKAVVELLPLSVTAITFNISN